MYKIQLPVGTRKVYSEIIRIRFSRALNDAIGAEHTLKDRYFQDLRHIFLQHRWHLARSAKQWQFYPMGILVGKDSDD